MNLSYETANIEQDIRTLENSIEVLSRVIACQTRG